MSRMEKDIEFDCCKLAWEEFGLLNLKQVSEKGLPDRFFFRRKKKKTTAFLVEFKDVDETAKKYQRHVHKQLRKSGISVYTDIDNTEDFREICIQEVHS